MKSDEGPPFGGLFVLGHACLRKRCDLALRIEMRWLPAEFAPRLGAAQALIPRTASRPFAEFGRDRVRGNDFRLVVASEASCKGAGDAGRPKIPRSPRRYSSSCRRLLQRKRIEVREVVAMHERPAHASLSTSRIASRSTLRGQSHGTRRRRRHRPSPGGSRCHEPRARRARGADAAPSRQRRAAGRTAFARSQFRRRSRRTASSRRYR